MNALALKLTARQREVMDGVANGLGNIEIAEVLRVQVRTVESLKRNARKRLGATTAQEAANMWVRGEDKRPDADVRIAARALLRAVYEMADRELIRRKPG